jgi:glucosylceramidase
MTKIIAFQLLICCTLTVAAQTKVEWIASSQTEHWKTEPGLVTMKPTGDADITIVLDKPLQKIDGFGTCFNELGWTSLSVLPAKDRESIMNELFAPGVGADFTICRMPVGANDFARHWYSYDETPGDFNMKDFSIKNDLQTLVPFIKNAQKYNPALQFWASPWSPPAWMKYNKHYAAKSVLGNVNFKSDEYGMDLTGINNGLPPDKEGREGTNMFIQQEKYFKAYALYFQKFIEAYRQEHINIGMVMPQNEFNSAQVFPSCTWTAAGLAKFISYLGPRMQTLHVKMFFGTVERANEKLVDTILTDPESSKYINGVGFQWAGKGAIGAVHRQYPHLTLYQTEQECGNGKNDWQYCVYTWGLLKHYFCNGANAYMYWNTSLKQGGISTWGWKQNSLVSVDTVNKTYTYNYEYYLLKHLSHFVKPGAKLLTTRGSFDNLLAFINPDKSIVIVVQNDSAEEKNLRIKAGDKMITPSLKPNTFNTFLIRQ